MLAGYRRSPFDATVVTRLADAGCVTLGKLNCDEFAMGGTNENSAIPPWAATACSPCATLGHHARARRLLGRLGRGRGRAPGAAVTGTDTGGSIRQPASFCGITGIKPTYGRASRYGMIAFASSLDQAGPMARSAEDCALAVGHVRPRPRPRLHQPRPPSRRLQPQPHRQPGRPAHWHAR